MKTAEEWAEALRSALKLDVTAINTGGPVFPVTKVTIEMMLREQHEATHKAMLEKVGQAISLVAREDSAFIPLFVALRDALNNVTFESTQEDK